MAGASLLGATSLLDTFDDFRDRWAGGSATWTVGTNVEYAVYVEFGTSRMAAQPFLRTAAERAMTKADRFADESNSDDELVEKLAHEVEREAKILVAVDTGTLRNSISAQRAD
jgi:phage gpG-like protein